MTASTEQERALANLRHLYKQMVNGAVKDSAQARRIAEMLLSPAIAKIEQAARRAPVVPQELREAAKNVVNAISAGPHGVTFEHSQARAAITRLSKALAVAHQPPACNPSMQPELATQDHIPAVGQMVAVPETAHASVKAAVHANLGTYRRVMAKRSTEAATVQLPEPDEYQYRTRPTWDEKHPWTEWAKCSKEAAADYERAPLVHDWAYEVRYLYDWHQVRQLLAAQEQSHGQQT